MAQTRGYGMPLPLPSAAGGDMPGTLISGGVYRVPAGEWFMQMGQQIGLQWFDPNMDAWRLIGNPGSTFDWVPTDGNNFRLVNLSGIVIGASITAAGSGGTNGIGPTQTGVTVTFGAPASALPGNTATAYAIIGGSVQAPTVTVAGAGFTVPPLILIDPPPLGGIQATAIATLTSGGGISSITMQNVGAGYTLSPNFWIIPQGNTTMNGLPAGLTPDPSPFFGNGFVNPTNLPALSIYQPNSSSASAGSSAGALLTPIALTGSGTLTGVVMLNYGGTYDGTHIPTVTVAGLGGSPTATAIMSMCCTSVTVGTAGVAYGSSAMWETSLGNIVPGQINNNMPNPSPARGVCVLAGGAVTGFTIENAGFGFQKVPTVAVMGTNTIPTTYATGTVVCGGVVDTYVLQGRLQ